MPDSPDRGVVVTLADIYRVQQETTIALTEIKTAIALQSHQDRADGITLSDHETRLRKVELKVLSIPSLGVLIAGAALAWSVFGK
jgi:hypothetical protein